MKTHLHEIQHPALQAALERFKGGLGVPFDPADPLDYLPFLTILEEEVHARVARALVTSVREATANKEQQTAAVIEEHQRHG